MEENSPAANANINSGDVIYSVNGFRVFNAPDFFNQIASVTPGPSLSLSLSLSLCVCVCVCVCMYVCIYPGLHDIYVYVIVVMTRRRECRATDLPRFRPRAEDGTNYCQRLLQKSGMEEKNNHSYDIYQITLITLCSISWYPLNIAHVIFTLLITLGPAGK